LAAVLALASGFPVAAQIRLLPLLPDMSESSSVARAYDINNNGVVVGIVGNSQQGFPTRWDNLGTSAFDLTPFGQGEAGAINDAGQIIVGSRIYQNGNIIELSAIPGGNRIAGAGNNNLNNSGQVVSSNAEPAIFNYNTLTRTNLTPPPGYNSLQLSAINASGTVAGFASLAGERHLLTFDGANWLDGGAIGDGNPTAINASGIVVGFSVSGDGGFIYRPGIGLKGLGQVFPRDINSHGDYVAMLPLGVAYLYHEGFPINLTALFTRGGPVAGTRPWFHIENVTGINDAGDIIGYGLYDSNRDGQYSPVGDQTRAFLIPFDGSTQSTPILPSDPNGGAPRFIRPAPHRSGWYDPPAAEGFRFITHNESRFTQIADFPVGFDQPFTVAVNDIVLGQFSPGQRVTFADYGTILGPLLSSGGVARFTVTGISPLAEAQSGLGFPIKLTFSADVVDFTMVPLAQLPGDANLDGRVDFADLVVLAQHYNARTDLWSEGDFTGDGNVDFADLVQLAQNYGSPAPPLAVSAISEAYASDVARAFASVPEPGNVALGLLTLYWGTTSLSRKSILLRTNEGKRGKLGTI
jgi:hypothetical protein